MTYKADLANLTRLHKCNGILYAEIEVLTLSRVFRETGELSVAKELDALADRLHTKAHKIKNGLEEF